MDDKTTMALIKQDMDYLKTGVQGIQTKLDELETKFVTRKEFEPVKAIAFGLVGMILLSIVGALLALVVKSGVQALL